MATTVSTARKRYWRKQTLVVGAILIAVACLSLGWMQLQEARQQELKAAIRAAGGKVRDSWSLMRRFQYWRDYGEFPANVRLVNLCESKIDDEWLRKHDWLAVLDVQSLLVDSSVKSADLRRLIEIHPLEELYLDGGVMTDEVIAALSHKTSLRRFGPAMCRLSDEQFSRLPIEQYDYLTIVETGVTPEGLQQLRRCSNLKTIGLDGEQFTPEIAKLLASLGTIENCLLYGVEITDEDLKELPQINTIQHLSLDKSRTTPAGVARLKAAMPKLTDVQ